MSNESHNQTPSDMDALILSNTDAPEELERLYREDPVGFGSRMPDLARANPDHLLLRAWDVRLRHEAAPARHTAWETREFVLLTLLALLAGTIARLPSIIPGITEDVFYMRNAGFAVFPALAAYFAYKTALPKQLLGLVVLGFVVCLAFINLLPSPEQSDTILLACIHLPLVLWSLSSLAYTGRLYRSAQSRLAFLRYNGETLAYTGMILICGVLLTGLTVLLFSVINVEIQEWQIETVVAYGLAGAPVIAAGLTYARAAGGERIAPTLAKVFTPLVLVTLLVYLGVMAALNKSPYTDRDFLISFNIMLVAVLALTIFSLSERSAATQRGISDFTTAAMVATALILNMVALSAILFRLASFGFTPNRIAVLGANLLIFVSLGGVLYRYVRYLSGRGDLATVENWIAGYLTAFVAWGAFMVFVYPFLFRFA